MVLAWLLFAATSAAQWVAFNDHAAGPGTHPNATAWNAFGTAGGGPGSAGFLRNIVTGTNLPVMLTIEHNGATAEGWQGSAAEGSPAYAVFNGYVDFNGTPYSSVAISGNNVVTYRFTGLNPARRYNFKGTAIRGDANYGNRWTLFELAGAVGFNNTHTPNAYTTGLAAGQVAINTGANHTASTGDYAGWDLIDPGSDGTIEVRSRHYTGAIPGGTASGSKGYGLTGLRLEESTSTNAPIVISQLQDQMVLEGETATFRTGSSASGLNFQWFKETTPLSGATQESLVFPQAQQGDSGNYFVVVSNVVQVVTSKVVQLTVYPNPSVSLVPLNSHWRYQQSGNAPEPAWKDLNYDDRSWRSGYGALAAEDNPSVQPYVETSLSLTGTNGRSVMTYYFRTTFTVDDPDAFEALTFTNLIDDGAVVYLNGHELYRLNLPEGPVAHVTAASESAAEAVFTVRHASTAFLIAGINVLAAEVHQRNTNSTDVVFGLAVQAQPPGVGRVKIISTPPNQEVKPGSEIRLDVAASGLAPLTYQWQRSSVNLTDDARITGSKTSRLTIPNAGFGDGNYYRVVVSNVFGAVTSSVVAVGVNTVQFTRRSDSITANQGGYSLGCSWGDFNNDGYLDLFIACDSRRPFLYANTGQGDFQDATPAVMLDNSVYSSCGAWGDYDNDGDLDLFVGSCSDTQSSWLYRNDGGNAFTRMAQTDMVQAMRASSRGGTWVDYDLDGDLDLFMVRNSGSRFLYRNEGSGSFTRVTTGALATEWGADEACAWADYDNDGDPDVFIANRNGNNFLYRNDRNGVFTRITTGEIVNDGGTTRGCAWGDYDNDGDLDLFVTNADGQRNCLYRNNGNGSFIKIAAGSIVTEIGNSTGCAWGDYDNDGFLDLMVCNNYSRNNFLYHNQGDGTFQRIPVGTLVNAPDYSHGCAWADMDNDGDLDLFITNWEGHDDWLFRNEGNENAWLNVRCVGTAANRSAMGARVRVKAVIGGVSRWQLREILGGESFSSQQSLNAEFGLGDATVIETVRVEWPSGWVQERHGVAVRQFLTFQEIDLAIQADNREAVVGGNCRLEAQTRQSELPLQWQWFFNGDEVPGATNASLPLADLRRSQAGTYTVRASDTNGFVISTPFTLTVREPLQFTTSGAARPFVHQGQLFLRLTNISPQTRSLVLEMSTNLLDWRDWHTNGVTDSAPGFIDATTNAPARFYRAKEIQ